MLVKTPRGGEACGRPLRKIPAPRALVAAAMNARLLAATAAVLVSLLVPAVAGAANPWLSRTGLNIAHQGGEIEAPSDTMYAFRTALEKGADVLEMDVHLSKDGHVVVLHDETVDRTTSGAGSVEDMTLAQIKALDAAHWFVPGVGTTHSAPPGDYALRGIATGEKAPPPGYSAGDFTIPTLEEVLRAFPDTLINVELKPTVLQTGRIELAVRDLLRAFGRTDDVIVVSFLDHSITLFKLLAPEVATAPATVQVGAFWAASQGPLPGIPLPVHVALQVPEVFNGIAVTSPDFFADAHRNGLAVHVWTINDEAAMRRLLDWGADGIMTDRPTLLERVLAERAAAQAATPAPLVRARVRLL
jgi:glycerophosphoryl diester phosphodiesterase